MRTNKSRLTILFVLLAFFAFSLSAIFMPKPVSAVSTDSGFYIEDGASVRLVDGQSGIKWTAHLTAEGRDKLIGETENQVTEIGIAIKPTGDKVTKWNLYPYEGNLKFSETRTEIIYSYAIYYDDIISDIEKQLGSLSDTQKAEYLANAYSMVLEAKPYAIVGGETVYGEVYDTARSVQGVALYYLITDYYAGNESALATLTGYLPNYNVAKTEYYAENSFYSNIDASGVIALDDAISVGEKVRIYYGAKDVTSAYDSETHSVNLSGIQAKVTTDGKVSDYLTVYDMATGTVTKQHFVGVTLAIDEASDFSYFSLKKTAGVAGGDNTAYIAPGDMEFDGYYVLTKDINFEQEGYAHDFYNGQVVSWGARGFDTCLYYIGKTHGLTGTFDGNGHAITDITFDNTATSGNSFEGGLFGWINGGTIKNTAFISPAIGDLNGGAVFAYAAINGSNFEDCYFYFDTSYGNYGTHQIVCTNADITFTRCYFEISSTSVTYNARGSFLRESPIMNDSYLVFSHSPFLGTNGTTTAQADAESAVIDLGTRRPVLADAAYVDGEANVATNDRFYVATRWDSPYYSLANYTIVHGIVTDKYGVVTNPGTTYEKGSTYEITLIEGLQRYTSKAKMAQVNNDFTAWDPDLWVVIDGVPTFKSIVDGEYSAYVNGEALTQDVYEMFTNDTLTVTTKFGDDETPLKPTLTIVSGEEVVSINGNVITAIAKGSAVVKATLGSASWIVNVNVANVTDYDKQLLFSAHDGYFFENSSVISVADILGDDLANVVKIVAEDGTKLTYDAETGALTGLDLGKIRDYVDTSILFYLSETDALRVSVNAVTLAIDEFADMNYFKVKEQAYYVSNVYTFADGDVEWDGYYVLLNDIDGKNASFSTSNGMISTNKTTINTSGKFSGRSGTQIESSSNGCGLKDASGEYVKGLTGTFDGRGYAIKNINIPSEDGLFGIIVGTGVIKNTAFVNVGSVTRSSIAAVIADGGTLQDCYVEYISSSKPYMGGSVTFDKIGDKANIKNVMLNVNFKSGFDPAVRSYSQWYSLFGNTIDDVFSDVYAISNIGVYNTLSHVAGSVWVTSRDAALVDGVASGVATTYQNIKRYTTAEKMSNDKANNDFDAWNPDVWVILDGVPTFKSTIDSATYSAYLGEAEIGQDEFAMIQDESATVSIKYGVAQVSARPVLSLVSGEGIVSINKNVVTALEVGVAVIKVTYGAYEWSFTLNVAEKPTDYQLEYQFSAYDGLFFDGVNVVSLDTVLAELTQLGGLIGFTDDNGNPLTYDQEKGAILGLNLGKQSTWADTAIIAIGENKSYRLLLKGADLIIDQATDFAYFSIDGDLSLVDGELNYSSDDFVWDGYCVMVKDIDASAYAHQSAINIDPTTVSMAQVSATNYGLSGVFDGQGHSIDRMFVAGNQGSTIGLFAFVNGGTIKNVKFTNLYSGTSSAWRPSGVTNYSGQSAGSRLFATYMVNGAKLQDVELGMHSSQGSNSRLVVAGADSTTSMTRVFISVSYAGINANGYYIMNDVSSKLTDVYVVANQFLGIAGRQGTTALVTKIVDSTTTTVRWQAGNLDAATVNDVTRSYVNGVYQGTTAYDFDTYTASTTPTGTTYSKDKLYSTKVLTGIKRYTTLDNMKANWTNFAEGDANRNDFSSWSSDIWTITDGVPSMHVMG